MSNRLIVGNLSSSVTTEELITLFGRFGLVESADFDNGVATVHMSNHSDAQQAKSWLNFSNYDGQILSVRQLD